MKSFAPPSMAAPQIAPEVAPAPAIEGARAPVGPSAANVGQPTLRRGSTGDAVRVLQEKLNANGQNISVDGIFGRDTEAAVRAFQTARGLESDGIVGAASWGALSGGGSTTGTSTTGTSTTGTTNTGSNTGSTNTGSTGATNTGTNTGATTTTTTTTTGTGTTGSTGTTGATGTAPQTVEAYMAGLTTLPRGDAMSAEQRATMYTMTATMTIAQIQTCFQHRFSHGMVDTTGAWTPALARAVWAQLDTLPDGHVTANTVLTTFQAISGSGGFGPSWEAPTQVNTIQLGEGNNPATMGHTVRHEVGHAVHAEGSYMPTINSWLQNEVGFWFFPTGAGGLRQWVEGLGGFGPLSNESQDTFMTHLGTFLGTGSSWNPARPTFTDGLSTADTAIYDSMPDAVKDGITQSIPHWYTNYTQFASGTQGKYFLNYWYQRGFFMSATAEACVAATGDNYTAMSEKEFFANCYAEYFENPAGFADPSLWGGSLPDSVKSFFRNHILERQPYTPPVATGPTAPATGAAPPPRPTGMAGTP